MFIWGSRSGRDFSTTVQLILKNSYEAPVYHLRSCKLARQATNADLQALVYRVIPGNIATNARAIAILREAVINNTTLSATPLGVIGVAISR